MLTYPSFNPIAFSIGPLQVHWYGLMYLLAFFIAWALGRFRVYYYQLDWTKEQLSDLIFYAALGAVLGGRLGYMLFYQTPLFLSKPWKIINLWEGGMSFHGGLLGVFIALLWFSRHVKKNFLVVSDFIAPLVPLGLAAGRFGNFINGELWGRVTDVPWAMAFPQAGPEPRHPSQLYEMGLEGFLMFIIIWWYAAKPRPPGCISGIFLMGYALCRLVVECFRQPDVQLGYLAFDWLTMGQLLSLPMFLAGFLLWWMNRHENLPQPH